MLNKLLMMLPGMGFAKVSTTMAALTNFLSNRERLGLGINIFDLFDVFMIIYEEI